jgi:penicillin amidase
MNPYRSLLRTFLGRRLPRTSGQLQVPGIAHPVRIRRDTWGIPYIEAKTDADAWCALGFCQGQDRAFQLEMLLRLTRGTLAELLGPAGLPIDRLARRIGFHRYAEAHLDVLDTKARESLEAFARGVNAGIARGSRRPAHEFALLRAQPTPYTAADALASMKYSALSMSFWTAKLVRFILLREEGPAALQALDGVYPDAHPVTSPVGVAAGRAIDRLGAEMAQLIQVLGLQGASNNWVLDASRTATGRPLLANDPHLATTIPSPWYLVHIRTPEWAVAGACYAGTTVIGAGHNGVAAWGLTAGLADGLDLFLEEIGPDGRSVRDGDGFVPCAVQTEVFHVKGGIPVYEEILITPRGPIVSPALEGEHGAVSMQATWMQPWPIGPALGMYRARTWEQFRQALAQWPLVSLNMVYADTQGTIGWQLIGDVPQRGAGHGVLPLPGWDPANQWAPAPVPFAEMPHLENPPEGLIATANNKPVQDGVQPYLGVDWSDGYRVARIIEVLSGRRDWNIPATQSLQRDQMSLPWREIREIVLAVPEVAETRAALHLLRDWDGVLSADSPAASIYEFFLGEMAQRVVRARLPQSADWALGRAFNPLAGGTALGARVSTLVRLLKEQPPEWFGRPWPEEIAAALAQAVHALQERYGPTPETWAWGRIRPLTLQHPLGVRRPLNRLLNLGPFSVGGDSTTVSPMGTRLTDVTGNPRGLANLRMVLDVGNWEESRFVLAGGQSGNPLSPHYDDMLEHWLQGTGVAIAWSPDKIAQIARSSLQLLPWNAPPDM